MKGTEKGILYIISTPIGNLKDITIRALDTLKESDCIVCEDTRITRKLLTKYEISKRLISLHSRSSESAVKKIVSIVEGGKNIAVVTDSGTPVISDPGCVLIKNALEAGIEVIPVPGPSAVHAALVASGFCVSEYGFYGFISSKKTRRKRKLEELKGVKTLLVFYEAPHRLLDFLQDVEGIIGNVPISVAKELTKRYERVYRGDVKDVIDAVRKDGVRGEYTIVVDNRKKKV